MININSGLLYQAMASYGKALAASERLFLMMFGNEQLALGNWVGLPLRYFYRCFDLVEGVITDSAYLATGCGSVTSSAPGSTTGSTSSGRRSTPTCRWRRRR